MTGAPPPPIDAPPVANSSSSSARRLAFLLLGLSVSALFVYLAFRKVALDEVFARILSVNPLILSLSVLSKTIGFVVASLRTRLLLAPIRSIPLMTLFRSVLLGFTSNNLLPFRTGELVRVDYLARQGEISRSTTFAVVLLERLLDSFVLLALFAGALPAAALDFVAGRPLVYVGASFVAALGGALWMSRRPDLFVSIVGRASSLFGERISSSAARHASTFARGLAGLQSTPRVVAVVIATVVFWVLSLLSIRIWLWAFDLSLPWYAPVLILGFASFGMALPASPGQIGTYHFFVALALTALSVDPILARSVAVVGHAAAFVPLTLAGLPLLIGYLVDASRRARPPRAAAGNAEC